MQHAEQLSQESSAIVIFGGGLKKDETTGRWRTTNFDEGDRFGVQGDRLRVVAGSMFAKGSSDPPLILLGGKGQLAAIPDAPCVADVMKQELVELGVEAERIIAERESGSTYQQLIELQKIMAEKRFSSLILISNRYNIPRIQAMIEYAPGLDTLKDLLQNRRIRLESAEEIAIKYDPETWEETIDRAYQSEAMRQRVQLEEKGVEEIKAGIYQYH